jgi:hypothetical protein
MCAMMIANKRAMATIIIIEDGRLVFKILFIFYLNLSFGYEISLTSDS